MQRFDDDNCNHDIDYHHHDKDEDDGCNELQKFFFQGSQIIYAWAMDAKSLELPKGVGCVRKIYIVMLKMARIHNT